MIKEFVLGKPILEEKTRVRQVGSSFGIRIPAHLRYTFPFSKQDKIVMQILENGVKIRKATLNDVGCYPTTIINAGNVYSIRIPAELRLIVPLNDEPIMKLRTDEVLIENV
jgi:hypothetical protein